ncbi:MAG: hydrogenase nickel incorporation protein HypB [Alphaproteobacteria bacterium]|nr:hydrogenase nickel incorporation protein HypB [Alphaproteobacteria bacterium]
MCIVCGCGHAEAGTGEPEHDHGHKHHHSHGSRLDFGGGPAGVSLPGLDQARILRIETDVLAENDLIAAHNRAYLSEHGILALNLVSSPGSGKTTLLVRTIADLKDRFPIAVIEGDQQTSLDTERICATGVPALQINTGKGCHLDAHMIDHALTTLAPGQGSLLLIENVGNLVCPAGFDLGEAHKVVILSVTEGEDKPLKYPNMFAAADLMILTKTDLLPYLRFDADRCIDYARRVNPKIGILRLSSETGHGLAAWYDWIEARRIPVSQQED